ESMKARIDTLESEDGSDVLDGTAVNATEQQQANYITTQGTDFSHNLPTYADSPENLDKLVSKDSLSLLAENSSNSSWKNWGILNQDKFTTTSRTLPVDVVNGRLKKDLTPYLKGSYSALDGEPMIDPRFSLTAPRQPTFDLLKQWANLVTDIDTPQKVTPPNLSSSPPEHGLYPVVTQGAVGMQQNYEILTPTTLRLIYMIQPQIQIHNPHNVPLAAQDYIVQVGYQFRWWIRADGTKGTDKVTWAGATPDWRSWESYTTYQPLPVHVPADNENIQYQGNKRFFTFVIKNQAFQPGESLVFYAKPPSTGPISGVPYNQNANADTNILNNFSNDQDLNLLVNEGDFNEFFYIPSNTIGTVTTAVGNKMLTELRTESNFNSVNTGSGATSNEDLDMHINLYSFAQNKPSLLHAIKIPQWNTRTGTYWRRSYPFSKYQSGSLLATDTYDKKSPLLNLGSSALVSNFDIFVGGQNINKPPIGGQPHSALSYWNIRNQESFSSADSWTSGTTESVSWLNAFSFRATDIFQATWEAVDNLYGSLSTDRLCGWHQSQVPGMVYPFFDYPTDKFGPLSMGMFQHADLSVYSWQPTYAFGNSQAPPRFDRTQYQSTATTDLYDVSYLLNASTWDQYYLSTIPQTGVSLKEGMLLPNSRQVITSPSESTALDPADLVNTSGFELSASAVSVRGGFNVNSTSFTAWRSFLAGALGKQVDTTFDNDKSNVLTAAAMGRFFHPLVEELETVTNDRDSAKFDNANSWASTRTLNETELDTLARRIVEEVKSRGPFLSISDFVNRRLRPDSDVTGDEKVYQEVLGTLQAAINKATLEDKNINHHFYANHGRGGSMMRIKPLENWKGNDNGYIWEFSVTQAAQEAMFGYPVSKIDSDGGLIHSYAPNFLSQADVLTKIGPGITVRGDTFVIRSYGDSLDKDGDIAAKAWCEAVVQRVAEPVDWDGSDAMLIQPQAPGADGFGRQFKIVSFRWLSQDEVQPYSQDEAIVQ
ncbi:MAG: hypothetical protein NWQ16_07110, partial [Akkermansiaceae bacterium]|nr:hypothetical protein [Akkermansiaceae bacterium]